MLVGNKETFAIEFIIDNNNPKMGYGKLWMQNTFLGTNEDLIYLNGYLISLIDELLNSKQIKDKVEILNKKEIFELLKSTSKRRSNYAVLGSTFTDDFEIYSYKENDTIAVIWKLIPQKEIIFEELKNYSHEIQFATASLKEIKVAKEKILEIITY